MIGNAQWRALRWIGVVLFVASFVVPNAWDWRDLFGGAYAFVLTPVMAFLNLLSEPNFARIASTLVIFAGWLANFTVPVQRKPVAVAAIVAVWTSYGCFFGMFFKTVPFYFWAVGITVIHVATLLKKTDSQESDTRTERISSF